jgi:amidase
MGARQPDTLVFESAVGLARRIRARDLSAVEVVRAFIAQVERVNPKVNAIVTFLPERALAEARAIDERIARGEEPGPLAGLPIAYKDMIPTRGVRTTFGSPIYADHVPAEDHVIVERLAAAGAVMLGKTNTPEFAAGSQTFNPVFGATRNPYDLTKTCGGSSGGAAVAVACGMLPFADGSDLGGSLRNPGNFNNVVGFRPTPGRVPYAPANDVWATMSVIGPIARSAADAALLLSAMAGPDARSPITITEPGEPFARPLERDLRGGRIAWWSSAGGRLAGEDAIPVDARVTRVLEPCRAVFESLGCIVEEAHPDLRGADEVFRVLRALSFVQRYKALYDAHRGQLKQTVIWNIEQGLALDPVRIARAFALRSELYTRMERFMRGYDFLALPVNQVPPFPLEQPFVDRIGDTRLESYIDWMKSAYSITVTSHPAISVPAGFTDDATPLPVGLQLVGRYRDDFGVLQAAHAFEAATRVALRRAPIVSAGG